VEINVTGDILTSVAVSTATRRTRSEELNWLANELWSGEFSRTLTLPVRVQADKSEARFEDGVLT